jgi:hypothetical protein
VGQAQQLFLLKPVMMGSHFGSELSHVIMNTTIFFFFLLSFEHVFF